MAEEGILGQARWLISGLPNFEARWLISGLPNFEYQLREYCRSGRKHITILLCGKTGVGKSHLTNALIGRVLAKEGEDLDPETYEATPYNLTINDVEITVYDTPGLADGTGNEEVYLEKIKEKVTVFDVFIFCTEMNIQRFRNDDIKTVQKLTEAFGSQLWEHAVVVLTFANEVHPRLGDKNANIQEFFDQRVRQFKKKIQEAVLNVGVPEKVIINMPFVAAGDLSEPRLPGIDNWLTSFWTATFKRLNRNLQPTFYLASVDRLNCITPSEQMPKSGLSLRSLPPYQSPGGSQSECSDDSEADKDGACCQFTSTHCVEERKPSKPERKLERPGKGKGATNHAPSIDLDGPSAMDIIVGIVKIVGGGILGAAVDTMFPGVGSLISSVFN